MVSGSAVIGQVTVGPEPLGVAKSGNAATAQAHVMPYKGAQVNSHINYNESEDKQQ